MTLAKESAFKRPAIDNAHIKIEVRSKCPNQSLRMLLTKHERLALIYQRLTAAPAAAGRSEALELIQRAFRDVENAHSGAPDVPNHPERMHPPVQEMEEDMPGHPAVTRYRHKRHYTLIATNGAFEVRRFLYSIENGKKRRVGEQTDFAKSGADGKGVI